MTGPRLVAVTDDGWLAAAEFPDRLTALLGAGLPALWLRARRMESAAFYERALEARAVTGAHGAELWIGDRADVATIVGADRLHLPEAGVPIAVARRVVGRAMPIGRSVHGVEAAAKAVAEGAAHLVVGTIFPTASHPGLDPAGPDLLTSVRSAIRGPGRPPAIYAIGGVEPGRVEAVRAAGADGVVALRSLWEADRPAERVAEFLEALDAPPR